MNKVFTIAIFALFCASAVPTLAQSPAPAMPSCSSGDPVVWENLSGSKVYHMQGDSYYGKTKKGAFACKSAADGSGFHASGSKSTKTTTPPSAAPSPMASASSKHHHKKSSASPAPSPAAT